jgi:hypothetical protein
MPVELGLWWLTPVRGMEVQAGATAGLEFLRVSAASAAQRESRLLPGPVGGLSAALRVPVGANVFLRVSAAAGLAFVKYDFGFRPQPEADAVNVFSAPTRRFYVRMGAEIGLGLPLMKKTSTTP